MPAIKAKNQTRTAQPVGGAVSSLLPIKLAAQRLGLSKWTLRRLVYSRRITHYKIGKLVMIAEEDIQRILTTSKVESIATK